jgi:hypothetical protein
VKQALIWVAVLVLITLLGVDVYLRLNPAKPRAAAPRPRAAPPAVIVEETVSTPSPEPTATATEAPPPVAVAEAKKPAAAKKPASKKPPAPPPPVASGPPPVAPPARRFVSGQTAIDGRSGPLPAVPVGFDAGGVEAKPVPKVDAQVELDVQPRTVAAGQPYTVKVYLRNQGKKAIKVKQLQVVSTYNGKRTEGAATSRLKEVPPGQAGLIAELPSIWKQDVTSWSMEIAVRSGHGETYRNTVSWR